MVELSVYVQPHAQGQGGAAFLNTLIISTEAAGIWTIRSGIFPENTARLAPHHRAIIGVRLRIDRHHGGWRGIILLERHNKTTARRSTTLLETPTGLPTSRIRQRRSPSLARF